MSGNKPARVFRIGNISATIWANTKDGREWYDVSIVRNFQDKNEWKTSTNFRASDLPVVAKVAEFALHWIVARPDDSDEDTPLL